MKDKIIEVLNNNLDLVVLESDGFKKAAEEIEKLYDKQVVEGELYSSVDAWVVGVNKPYDKSKFKIFPTWKETKEVSEISDEVFLGFVNECVQCNGFDSFNKFNFHCDNITCYECILDSNNTKADIIKWMEETG